MQSRHKSEQYNNGKKRDTLEQDQGGYLHHDECDGLIFTVGHKDQVSSSCIMLTLLISLPVCKCAQFRCPSSKEQINPFNHPSFPSGPRPENHKPVWDSAAPFLFLLLRNAQVWTATGLRTLKPRRRMIWGCGGSPSGLAPYPTTAGDRGDESQSSRGCWSHPGGDTLLPSPEIKIHDC